MEKEITLLKLFEKGDGAIHSAENELAKLFRLAFVQTAGSYSRWTVLLNRYINSQADDISKVTKGNLNAALKKDKMNWGVMVRGFNVLRWRVKKVILVVESFDGDEERVFEITAKCDKNILVNEVEEYIEDDDITND